MDTVWVKPVEVKHLTVVKVRIQVIHRHLVQRGFLKAFQGFLALKMKDLTRGTTAIPVFTSLRRTAGSKKGNMETKKLIAIPACRLRICRL